MRSLGPELRLDGFFGRVGSGGLFLDGEGKWNDGRRGRPEYLGYDY